MKLVNRIAVIVPIGFIVIALAAPDGAAAADTPPAQPVSVVTSDYHFSPDKLALKRGVAYRLHIENHGKEMHEFNAPAFFQSVELGDPQALNADRTEIAVRPGEARDLTFVPRQVGQYRLICPDHDWTGMIGEITVE